MCFCCSCTWTSPRFPKALLCTMKIIFYKTHGDYNKSKPKFLLAKDKYTKTLLMFNKNLKKEWSWTYNLKLITCDQYRYYRTAYYAQWKS